MPDSRCARRRWAGARSSRTGARRRSRRDHRRGAPQSASILARARRKSRCANRSRWLMATAVLAWRKARGQSSSSAAAVAASRCRRRGRLRRLLRPNDKALPCVGIFRAEHRLQPGAQAAAERVWRIGRRRGISDGNQRIVDGLRLPERQSAPPHGLRYPARSRAARETWHGRQPTLWCVRARPTIRAPGLLSFPALPMRWPQQTEVRLRRRHRQGLGHRTPRRRPLAAAAAPVLGQRAADQSQDRVLCEPQESSNLLSGGPLDFGAGRGQASDSAVWLHPSPSPRSGLFIGAKAMSYNRSTDKATP